MFNWFRKRKPLTREETIADLQAKHPNPRCHDLRVRCWGHSMSQVGDHRFALWTSPQLKEGDLIYTELGTFIAHDVEQCRDPADMSFASFFKVSDDCPERKKPDLMSMPIFK